MSDDVAESFSTPGLRARPRRFEPDVAAIIEAVARHAGGAQSRRNTTEASQPVKSAIKAVARP
jgi:hypothetical protein